MALAINPDFHRDRCTIDSRQIAAAPLFESHYTSCSLACAGTVYNRMVLFQPWVFPSS